MDGNPQNYQFNLPPDEKPSLFALSDKWYPGISEYWQEATSNRIYHPIDGIRAIVIHATAGSSSIGAISVMKQRAASFHWLVPDEDEDQHGKFVWACAPEALAAWHVKNSKFHPDVWNGKKRVNHWSLGIEVVNSQTSSDFFSDWQIRATALIVRYCWAKYPNLVHVVSHAKLDPDRRSDPGANFPWEHFQQLVLSGENDPPEERYVTTHASLISEETSTQGCCNG